MSRLTLGKKALTSMVNLSTSSTCPNWKTLRLVISMIIRMTAPIFVKTWALLKNNKLPFMDNVLSLPLSTISFPEIRLPQRAAAHLRGFFGDYFREHSPLLHNHYD